MSDYYKIKDHISKAIEYRNSTLPICLITYIQQLFNVPYDRLKAYIYRRPSKIIRDPTNRKLLVVQESVLEAYLRRLDAYSILLRLRIVALVVNSILRRAYTDPSTDLPIIRAYQAKRQQDYNPYQFKRRQKLQELLRAVTKELEDLIGQYTKYFTIYKEYSIIPSNTQNIDKSSFRVGIAKAKYVLTKCLERKARILNSSNRKSLTVIEAILVGREKIPPILVLISKQYISSQYRYLYDNTLVSVSNSGYTNN